MSFSVIIPTMWKANRFLEKMIVQYEACPDVEEILIIYNALGPHSFVFDCGKVRVLNDGTNLFVNPSWNLGVSEAAAENVLIANDDIHIVGVCEVINFLKTILRKGIIIGPDKNCFPQNRTEELGQMRISRSTVERGYGFGVFMSVKRESYIPIPKELKVWFGDTFLHTSLESYLLHGVNIITPMRTTSRNMNLREHHAREKAFYRQWQLKYT